ncbi:MAG: hypothetical protein FWD76_00510 [Firmicutes bacterium]|nr:hypothetical protein [Bacillota bacterium]
MLWGKCRVIQSIVPPGCVLCVGGGAVHCKESVRGDRVTTLGSLHKDST